ncbi:hypothetical protein VKT23_014208 [Stygiomarasmius scandens]|uniref:F-box domain-containing protein n=1 Tax=Marasmiellus scandens TaxID=2682957 RepID=A0ABR1J0U1_9AGAR
MTFTTSFDHPRVSIRDANDLSSKLIGLSKYRTLKEILAQGQSDLDYYDTEISLLKKDLHALEEKRARLHAYLEKCRALNSPIQGLPPELLSEIFALSSNSMGFGSPYWVPSGKPRDRVAFRLAAVCSRWRNLALSTPGLWSRLEISFSPSWPSWVPVAIDTCLERSGQHVLSVMVEGCLENLDKTDWQSVLHSLARQAHRWGSADINLSVPPHLRQECLDRMTLHSFPVLGSLTIGAPGQWVTLQGHSMFRNTPKLSTLKLYSEVAANNWRRYDYNITALTLRGTNLLDTMNILRQCKGLTSLNYTHAVNKREYSILRNNVEAGVLLPVHLDRLRSLSIFTPQDFISSTMSLLASLLRLPALTSLAVEQTFRAAFTEHTLWTAGLWSFLSITSCSETLTALSLKSFMPADEIDSVLAVVPNLSEFSFHCTSRSTAVEWDGLISCLYLPSHMPAATDTKAVPIQKKSFIPKLKHLSLHVPNSDAFDLEGFAEAIRSRWMSEGMPAETAVDCIRSVELKMRRSQLAIIEDDVAFDILLDLELEGLILAIGVLAPAKTTNLSIFSRD